ncbi:PREDICTED: uncharacterized protein LOC107195241 [Dufourea novaeangliae]|uniref:Uncharacterized protein n=1 Tax=Dufourea novaeangliae TaxID=178035 RepID=A0A154P771_DUFNO|nr:PREDICTED: uncharacterized protein LOC107195241 [Dufourea novaeangliae]KZC06970.1 hypothetical protein WN55_08207 [Dufourea novaeangliae]
MTSDDARGTDITVEIHQTLLSINRLTLKIKNELGVINELIKENGQLSAAVTNANETLTAAAEGMGINVEDVLHNNEEENEFQVDLKSCLSSAEFQKKITACLNNM